MFLIKLLKNQFNQLEINLNPYQTRKKKYRAKEYLSISYSGVSSFTKYFEDVKGKEPILDYK